MDGLSGIGEYRLASAMPSAAAGRDDLAAYLFLYFDRGLQVRLAGGTAYGGGFALGEFPAVRNAGSGAFAGYLGKIDLAGIFGRMGGQTVRKNFGRNIGGCGSRLPDSGRNFRMGLYGILRIRRAGFPFGISGYGRSDTSGLSDIGFDFKTI